MRQRSSTSSSSALREAWIIASRGALFCALFVAIVGLLNFQLGHNSVTATGLDYQQIATGQARADVIVLGSSEMQTGVDPRAFELYGIGVYNFALRAASPLYFLNWYRTLFREHHPKPRVAILGTPYYVLDADLDHPFELDSAYLPTREFVDCLAGGEFSRSRLIKGRFPVIRDRKKYGQLLAPQLDLYMDPDRYYRGYLPYVGIGGNLRAPREVPATVDAGRFAAFEELVRTLLADDIRVIFVEPPVYLPGIIGDRTCLDPVRELARELEIPLFEYNAEYRSRVNFDAFSYHDCVHLNRQGSQRFSEMLARDLAPLLGVTGDQPTSVIGR